MEKSKLGLSIGLLSALMFLTGYANITAMLLVAGYILIREESRVLKKHAVGTIVLYLAFMVLNICIGLLENLFAMSNVGGWMYDTVLYVVTNGFFSTLNYIVAIAEKVVFGLLAVFALGGKEIKIPLIDKFVEKHF